MKTLITGGTGLVGRYLKELLPAEETFILSRQDVDIANFYDVRRLFNRIQPDIVFHLAAFTDVDRCECEPVNAFRTNVTGTFNVAFFAEEFSARIIYLSTDFVFDGKKNSPYNELDITCPLSVYGKTKLEGERIIRDNCGNYSIVRTSRIFGKYGHNFASQLPRKLLQGHKVKITTDLINSPTYARDLAVALVQIATSKFCGLIHFCNDGYCSWYDFGFYICKQLGLDTSLLIPVSINDFADSIAKRPSFSTLDTSLFGRKFYKPRPWHQALEEFLNQEIS